MDKTLKRCPIGYRRDPETKECVPIESDSGTDLKKRCPPGQRKDPKTRKCISYKEGSKERQREPSKERPNNDILKSAVEVVQTKRTTRKKSLLDRAATQVASSLEPVTKAAPKVVNTMLSPAAALEASSPIPHVLPDLNSAPPSLPIKPPVSDPIVNIPATSTQVEIQSSVKEKKKIDPPIPQPVPIPFEPNNEVPHEDNVVKDQIQEEAKEETKEDEGVKEVQKEVIKEEKEVPKDDQAEEVKNDQLEDTIVREGTEEQGTQEQEQEQDISPVKKEPDENDYKQLSKRQYLLQQEALQHGKDTVDPVLYPDVNDPDFATKIAQKKEFYYNQYDAGIYDIRTQSDVMCNATFEVAPHQMFIKMFMSPDTPYRSLLLYHGLGTGKTCTAIGVAETFRHYMKQTGRIKKILIVANANVCDNFRKQLFDESQINDLQMDCVGNDFIKEVNPSMNLTGVSKDVLVDLVHKTIKKYYRFIGYQKLANEIYGLIKSQIGPDNKLTPEAIGIIQRHYDDRLVIVDEVHNIRDIGDVEDEDGASKKAFKDMRKIGQLLTRVVTHANNMRLLLLTATPIFNSFEEAIWLTNLMNLNDKRPKIMAEEVFYMSDSADGTQKRGEFREKTTIGDVTLESGRDLLRRKLTGYVSYVRSENPYAFPYRVYPDTFLMGSTGEAEVKIVATTTFDGKEIKSPLKYVKVYENDMESDSLQGRVYSKIVESIRNKPADQPVRYYSVLQQALQGLNMVYGEADGASFKTSIGNTGFDRAMKLSGAKKNQYVYADTENRVFAPENIRTHSAKIANIVDCIKKADGIVLVYSQYLKSGIVSVALALEEAGFHKYASSSKEANSLFVASAKRGNKKVVPVQAEEEIPAPLQTEEAKEGDVTEIPSVEGEDEAKEVPVTELPSVEGEDEAKEVPVTEIPSVEGEKEDEVEEELAEEENKELVAEEPVKKPLVGGASMSYILITGDPSLSPNNAAHVARAVSKDNTRGQHIKVILISDAGSEGIDFKYIRQVHVMEPWYNMNKIEQVIGRAVRNKSHCALPFEERNVEIYLHTTRLKVDETQEAIDTFVYRHYAESKAIQNGQITRLMKEVSIDCVLNIGQMNMTVEKLQTLETNKNIQIHLSSSPTGTLTDFAIGDKPHTDMCDYMDTCTYSSSTGVPDESSIVTGTYSSRFIFNVQSILIPKIKALFREQAFLTREDIVYYLTIKQKVPLEQIYTALTYLIEDSSNYLVDRYGRIGNLVNFKNSYFFQPAPLLDEQASIYEKSIPIEFKKGSVSLDFVKPVIQEAAIQGEDIMNALTMVLNYVQVKTALWDDDYVDAELKAWCHSLRLSKDAAEFLKTISNSLPGKNLTQEDMNTAVLGHFVDTLSFPRRLALLEYVLKEDIQGASAVKAYLDTRRLPELPIYELFNESISENEYYRIGGSNTLQKVQKGDVDLDAYFKDTAYFVGQAEKVEPVFGFIMRNRHNNKWVFKLKEKLGPDNRYAAKEGSECRSGIKNLLTKNKAVLPPLVVNIANMDGRIVELCIMTELVLRFMNTANPRRSYFVTSEHFTTLYGNI